MLTIRSLFAPLVLALLLSPLSACGDDEGDDDDDDDDDDDVVIDAPVADDAAIDSPIADDGGPADAAADAAVDSGSANLAPVINEVTWTAADNCINGTASNFTITLDVTDESPGTLVYSDSIPGCGAIDSNPDSVSCPNAAPYSGSVTVTDEGGLSDSQAIVISPCQDGSAP
jgi:hypothetical protein